MRPGSPGFVGQRLREAREARELTAVALADLIGVTRQAVSQYENGLQTPAPEVMRRITEVVRLPYHFFLAPPSPEERDLIFYQ
jgi:transcriptional regulator with XRE-family HTH domain